MNSATWYGAAAYCNWLSKQEGIDPVQWCYVANGQGQFAEEMKLKENYLHLEGYRLPSEAEWEYACRSGTVTRRYYGESDELLGKYAWYTKNSQDRGMLPGRPGLLGVPGDALKPNDFGLFDMLGNALEWCQDPFSWYQLEIGGKPKEDMEHNEDIKDINSRVLRGGSFIYLAASVRSANRYRFRPSFRYYYAGIRPARTFH
jgi:formylglycine-generating enzyme required for sulfatase activity